MGSTMTIGKRLIITSGVLVFLSVALATVAVLGLNGIGKGVHSMATDTVPGIVYASAIRGDFLALRGEYFKHIAESDPATIAKVEQNIADDDANIAADMKSYEDAMNSQKFLNSS